MTGKVQFCIFPGGSCTFKSLKVDFIFLQGVVKALFQQELLPRVISGSSVGSIGESCRGRPVKLQIISQNKWPLRMESLEALQG